MGAGRRARLASPAGLTEGTREFHILVVDQADASALDEVRAVPGPGDHGSRVHQRLGDNQRTTARLHPATWEDQPQRRVQA